MEGGELACVVYEGHTRESAGLQPVMALVGAQWYRIAGPLREVYLAAGRLQRPNQYVTEIQCGSSVGSGFDRLSLKDFEVYRVLPRRRTTLTSRSGT